jgi:O-antigen/teichoic acid export membrane protein
MSIYKSIAKNYVANGIGVGMNFLNQIAMVPLFISLWGIDKYADWILITAFSSFFAMTNMGLNTITMNEFAIKYQQREYLICSKLLINAFLFITVVSIIVILLSGVVYFVNGFKNLLQVSMFSETETSVVFILLLFQIFVKMYSGIYDGIFRAISRTYFCTMTDDIVKLSELIILFAGLIFRIHIVTIVTLLIIPGFVGIIYKHISSRKWFKLKFSVKLIDIPLLKSYMKPSFAFMFAPLGYAVSNQGMVFIVNVCLGPAILIAFTTTRTFVNVIRLFVALLKNAVWPEISVAYGKKDINAISVLYYRSLLITSILTILCVTGLAFLGKPIYLTWTKHAVLFEPVFFYGMLAVLLTSCLWEIISVVSWATNNHIALSLTFFIIRLLEVGFTYLLLTFYPHIAIIPMIIFFVELYLLGYGIKKSCQIININLKTFRKGLVKETNTLIHIFMKFRKLRDLKKIL